MKFKKIQIEDFQQFKEFELDLTYPKGHPRAGEPLDKVCFIGQSGTGKTTLLQFLKTIIYRVLTGTNFTKSFVSFNVQIEDKTYLGKSVFDVLFKKGTPSFDIEKLSTFNFYKKFHDITTSALVLLSFPANIFRSSGDKFKASFKFIDLESVDILSILNNLESSIQDYKEKTLSFRDKIARVSESLDINQIRKAVEELEEWKQHNPSPIDDIAENCLDRMLNKFGLRVKREFVFEKKEDIQFLKIETMDGKEVPYEASSTGTRQILLTALPLYLLKPNDTVILFDEPETSLFPTVQREIIEYYSSFTTNSQFFYATHSPIIAASFEPCERFILYFDENYNIRAKRGIAPEGDDPNDLLIKDFGLPTSLGVEGEIQFERFKSLIPKIKNESDPGKKADLINEYMVIGSAYNFGYDLKMMENEANYKKRK